MKNSLPESLFPGQREAQSEALSLPAVPGVEPELLAELHGLRHEETPGYPINAVPEMRQESDT